MIPLENVRSRQMDGQWTQIAPESGDWEMSTQQMDGQWTQIMPESSAWAGPESAAWAGPESSAWTYEAGDAAAILGGVTKLFDPITGMVKWFSGGKEISQAEANAKLEMAKAQQYQALAQLQLAKRKGVDWTIIALIGGAVALAFFVLRKP